MHLPPGLNFATVKKADDFLLVDYHQGAWTSRWFPDGKLADRRQEFFREITLEASLELTTLFPDDDITLLEGAHGEDGWRLVWNRHGYLHVINRGNGQRLASSRLPLATYVDKSCRIGFLVSNLAYGRACRGDLADTINYSQISLFAAQNQSMPLRPVFSRIFEHQTVPPVPTEWLVPEKSPVASFRAYNTVRHELWQLPDDQPGPCPDQDFSGASRVFGRYDAKTDTLHLLTGPEFLRTDSYWLCTRIRKARPGRTRLRLYLSKYNAMPNMAPVFFWSTDRRHWQPATLLEPSTETGLFQPLLTAPAEDFYLSSSLPFLDLERDDLCRQAAALPYVSQETIGHSVAGNPIVLLTATDPAVPASSKQDILIIIGQHSPQEMIGGHAILPLLTELAARPGLLQRLALHIVPTVNVDAAAYGSDGLNLNLFNTNRCWLEDPQPEIEAIKSWCRREPRRLLLFFDWHAGGTWRNHTLLWFNREVKNKYAPAFAERLDQRQQTMLELLGRHCGIRPQDGIEHVFRNCCATDWFQVNYPECLPLTIEFSTCSNFDPRVGHTVPVSADTVAMIGRQLAAVLQELLAAGT